MGNAKKLPGNFPLKHTRTHSTRPTCMHDNQGSRGRDKFGNGLGIHAISLIKSYPSPLTFGPHA